MKQTRLGILEIITFFISVLGLILSNNRAAIIGSILVIFIMYLQRVNSRKYLFYFIFLTFFILIVIYFIGINNIIQSLDFSSNSLYTQSNLYLNETYKSSWMNILESVENKNLFLNYFISFLSFFSFYLNRSELWGIFFTRYNPNFPEFLLGSGPLNFGQLYGEVIINETRSFLLPHSSLIPLFLFVGIVGTLFIIFTFLARLVKSKIRIGSDEFLFISFILLNVIKSDSLIYQNSLINYFFIFYYLLNRKIT